MSLYYCLINIANVKILSWISSLKTYTVPLQGQTGLHTVAYFLLSYIKAMTIIAF